MILTIPVLLYQPLFVLILYVASRFGSKALTIATILCLVWTATHLFFPPLAVLQTCVILGSYFWMRSKLRARTAP
jgi:hypothetical protein